MAAHGRRRHGGIACLDPVDDAFVLFDDQVDRRRVVQAEIADPVHLRLDALDHPPGVGAAHRQGEGAMEFLVEGEELVVVAGGDGVLSFDQAAQFLDGGKRRGRRGLPRDGDFDGLADETGVQDVGDGNLDDEGATLRLNADEAFFGQLDEGFAHGLPAGRILAGDFRFGESLSRADFSPDDGAMQLAIDLGADRGRLVQPGRARHGFRRRTVLGHRSSVRNG